MQTLPALAKEVNVRLEKADQYHAKGDEMLIAAGRQLIEARRLCQTEGLPWQKWVHENIRWSYDRCKKLISYAESDSPEEAVQRDREARRERYDKSKQRQAEEKKRQAEREVEEPDESEDDEDNGYEEEEPEEDPQRVVRRERDEAQRRRDSRWERGDRLIQEFKEAGELEEWLEHAESFLE